MRLTRDGTAYVHVFYEDLEWKDGISPEEIEVADYLRGDVGRIRGRRQALYSGRFQVKPRREKWDHPGKKGPNRLNAMEPDGFFHFIRKSDIDPNKPACAELEYQILYGFCIYQEDFRDIYGTTIIEGSGTEVCSIEANAESTSLELSVSFPSPDSYPSEQSVSVHAWINRTDERTEEFRIMRGDYCHVQSEETYLRAEAAIQFRPELLQVSLSVRQPQPGVTYSLRWGLNPRPGKHAITAAEQKNIASVRDAFRGPGDDRVAKFLSAIRAGVAGMDAPDPWGDGQFALSADTEILAFGFDFGNGCFKLSLRDQECEDIRLGRGVIGAAWRTQSAAVFVAGDKNADRPEPESALAKIKDPHCIVSLPIILQTATSIEDDENSTEVDEDSARAAGRDRTVGMLSVIEHGDGSTLLRLFDPEEESKLDDDGIELLQETRNNLTGYLQKLVEEQVSHCFLDK